MKKGTTAPLREAIVFGQGSAYHRLFRIYRFKKMWMMMTNLSDKQFRHWFVVKKTVWKTTLITNLIRTEKTPKYRKQICTRNIATFEHKGLKQRGNRSSRKD